MALLTASATSPETYSAASLTASLTRPSAEIFQSAPCLKSCTSSPLSRSATSRADSARAQAISRPADTSGAKGPEMAAARALAWATLAESVKMAAVFSAIRIPSSWAEMVATLAVALALPVRMYSSSAWLAL